MGGSDLMMRELKRYQHERTREGTWQNSGPRKRLAERLGARDGSKKLVEWMT